MMTIRLQKTDHGILSEKEGVLVEISVASCRKILLEEGVNPASTIEYAINGEAKTVTLEWIITSFMNGSEETKNLFYGSLKKIAGTKNRPALKEYFENMGKLIFLSAHPN